MGGERSVAATRAGIVRRGMADTLQYVGWHVQQACPFRQGEGVTGSVPAWNATWRQQDYDVLTSAEFRQALKDAGVILVTWRDIQKAMYPVP